mmetsp:Transcript_84583/g.244437  ORF Transcript_84583/g.244437 Transcript_84583/m.244437 type:complete len:145 (-) Transcript_84583:79-513(-)
MLRCHSWISRSTSGNARREAGARKPLAAAVAAATAPAPAEGQMPRGRLPMAAGAAMSGVARASSTHMSWRTPSDGGASHFEGTPRQDCAMKRVGLRRSAMLYRLLSHVPESALARELADSGVDVEAAGLHDREAMIEAILEELS